MKKHFYLLLITASIILTLGACEFETSNNGNLDGNWQLTEVDTLHTGGIKDMKALQIFYAIQMRLINVSAFNDPNVGGNYYFHFEHQGDSLIFKTANSEGKTMYTTEQLQPFGLNKEAERFKIISLSSNNMILKSEMLILKFRKF